MRKKVLYPFLILTCVSVMIFFIDHSYKSTLGVHTPCAFCNQQIVNRQKFYEDDLVIALCTHKPIVPSHFLIIPKRHVERLELLSPEEVSRIYQVIEKVNRASKQALKTSSYFIHQKNGREVGQTVPHVHFHFIAKPAGDDSHLKFFTNMILSHLKGPKSSNELSAVLKKMQASMESLEHSDNLI